jgi:hypothetical protein
MERSIRGEEAMNAYEWGVEHNSCATALKWRRTLGSATQRSAWRRCQRGDWLIWQLLFGLQPEELEAIFPQLDRAIERIVERAIRNHALHCDIVAVEQWATCWLSGEDRSLASARSAAEAAFGSARLAARAAAASAGADRTWPWAWALAGAAAGAAAWSTEASVKVASDSGLDELAARAAELRLQARDIRREIPCWPGGVTPRSARG